jgi:hypothetical protein
VSKDGKVTTITSKGVNAEGKPVTSTTVRMAKRYGHIGQEDSVRRWQPSLEPLLRGGTHKIPQDLGTQFSVSC